MLFFITIITIFSGVYAYNPSCSSCKNFIPYYLGNQDLGLCKMFKNISYNKGVEKIMNNYATHCRNDENLCGNSGYLYEPIADYDKNFLKQQEIDFNELNNRCCGEVNEKDEIDQLEKDFFEIYQKIKNHNKKKIYKTTKDLYKLFKRPSHN
jgi:hypothetical protein